MAVRLSFSGGSASQEWGVSLAGIGGQLAQEYTPKTIFKEKIALKWGCAKGCPLAYIEYKQGRLQNAQNCGDLPRNFARSSLGWI